MTTAIPGASRRALETLETYGFDEQGFAVLQQRVREGDLSPESNVLADVQPPRPEDLVHLPGPGTDERERARAAGLEVLRAGGFASVVLNGGMASRFGGVVKGAVEAVGGRSFLELKLGHTEQVADEVGAPVPSVVMTSFSTDAATRELLAAKGLAPLLFSQYVSLRLEPDGELFRTADGDVSLYGPGHGDVLLALRRSGTLDALRERGVRHLMVSNVDNLPARVDPVVVGTHVLQGRPMTAEVVPNEGDVGGAPARVAGRTMVVESMRFPPGFDHSSLPATNVNTMTFDLEALDRDFDLTWVHVQKKVEDRTAVQLERMAHEASAVLDATFLVVPATGPQGRFIPVKTPADLEAVQPQLRELLARPVLG
jgi:UTP--glucose-1-phosphate uridylyltransferase